MNSIGDRLISEWKGWMPFETKSEIEQLNKRRAELILTDPKRENVKELKDLKEDTHLRYNNNNNSNNSKPKTKVVPLMKKCLQMQKGRINCMR